MSAIFLENADDLHLFVSAQQFATAHDDLVTGSHLALDTDPVAVGHGPSHHLCTREAQTKRGGLAAASEVRAAPGQRRPESSGGRREFQPKRVGNLDRRGFLQPHFESPQLRQVMQPSIITTAAVLHFVHSCAPCG